MSIESLSAHVSEYASNCKDTILKDKIGRLLKKVDEHTLSTTKKILGFIGGALLFTGWIYLAYHYIERSKPLMELKETVLALDINQKGVSNQTKTAHKTACTLLISENKLNSHDLYGANFSHEVARDLEKFFGTEWTEEFKTTKFPLYYGIARSLDADEDLTKFKQLPAFAKRITSNYTDPITKEKKEINEEIDIDLLEGLRSKLKELKQRLTNTPSLPQYFATKYSISLTNADRMIDSIIEERIPHTSKSTLSNLGTVFFGNLFETINTFSNDPIFAEYQTLPYKNELFCITHRLAQSASIEAAQTTLPDLLKRVGTFMKNDRAQFEGAFDTWIKQDSSKRMNGKEFLDFYEDQLPVKPKGLVASTANVLTTGVKSIRSRIGF